MEVIMYRPNPLQRGVLITFDEVIFHIHSKQTLDTRTIQNSIIVAEERLIRPALGYDFYRALVDEKNRVVTDENKDELQNAINASLPAGAQEVTLAVGDIVNALEFLSADNKLFWKEHLWKLTAECVVLGAYPDNYVQFSSEGTIHNQPAGSPISGGGIVTPELRSIKWAMDKKMMDRIDPLLESAHLWLCKQQKADSTKFTDYTRHCDCDHHGVAYKRKTDIVLGLYDDIDRPHRYRDPLHFNDCDC
jgi:hypothetical protein